MEGMRACTSDIGHEDSLDGEAKKVVWGGVAGMYTQMQSIVMFDGTGQMWAAFIDSDADCVRYFTNVPESREVLPETFNRWRQHFAQKPVRYCEAPRVVPA
jgi:hypothetical protein